MFFGTILIASYIVRIFELPYHRTIGDPFFDSYFNSFYFVTITLMTIGYGDYSPGTIPGMVVTLVLALWGALLMSIVVVSISNMWLLNEN